MNLNIKNLQYVLFDWDNTLAVTRPILVKVVNEVLTEYNLPPWEEVKKQRNPDLSFRDNFPNIFGKEHYEEAYERYRKLYLEQMPSLIQTFSKVPEVLDFFNKKNIPMIIVSNKDKVLLEREVSILFKSEYFYKIVSGHEAERDKPYPEQIFFALKGLLKPEEITPEKVWMIGDSPQDSRCAQAAHARAIRIGTPIWEEKETQWEAVEHFSDFECFYKALAKN